MSKLVAVAVFLGVVATSTLTFADKAKAAPSVQNHHCKMQDGSMDMKKTRKECSAAKGTWAKDDAVKAPPKDAPKDPVKSAPSEPPKMAPKDAPKPAPTKP